MHISLSCNLQYNCSAYDLKKSGRLMRREIWPLDTYTLDFWALDIWTLTIALRHLRLDTSTFDLGFWTSTFQPWQLSQDSWALDFYTLDIYTPIFAPRHLNSDTFISIFTLGQLSHDICTWTLALRHYRFRQLRFRHLRIRQLSSDNSATIFKLQIFAT